QIILLKCTSQYPSDATESHLRTIPFLAERFGVMVGLSDHTLGTAVAVASVGLGVRVIEKHFTLSRAEGGVDAAFSLEPAELAQLVADTHSAFRAMGQVQLGPTPSEKNSLGFRRSLYICEDLLPGDVLNEKNLRAIRPGYGLAPKYLPDFLGKKVQVAVKRGTPLSWQLIAEKVEESVV
ncbi:MAG: N-acetylneuraminate synthase family protein, partial [Cyanobacteria bacterium]|nr:N-acetylneuraminate synthase family protein [Cyanobacteriota bacterium]